MNGLITLLLALNYRIFFFYVIPIVTVLVWILKYGEMYKHNILNGIEALLFQLTGIYMIGVFWLLLYAIYKGAVINNSKKTELNTPTPSIPLTFTNYQKAVFYAWLVAMANIILGIY